MHSEVQVINQGRVRFLQESIKRLFHRKWLLILKKMSATTKEVKRVQEEYRDADFNMRAIFYEQTVQDSTQGKFRKPAVEPAREKLRKKVKSDQMRPGEQR